jgi:predicted murein hydrolase (TIGR00659 family)
MDKSFNEIWVYLATSPLLWLTATLLAYQGAYWVFKRSGEHPLANPVLLAVLILAGILSVTGVSYQRYFEGAQFVHFLLGPATVALAVPLYAQFQRVSERALPVTVALLAGSLSAIVSAMAIAYWLSGSLETILSLAPKSVTTPIAMGIAERVGGLPSLTAVLVVLTGIFGAMIATTLFRIIGIKDHAVQGLAMGLASHGLGTARAFQISEQAGAFSALAMGLNGLLTALLIPLLMPLVHRLMG